MDFEKKYIRNLDWLLILLLMCLGIFSFIGISGATATANYEWKQVVWYALGFMVLAIILLFDYESFSNSAYVLYGIGIILIIGVLFVPVKEGVGGARSWYQLGVVDFQPAELMKIFTIIAVARYISKKDEEEEPINNLKAMLPIFLLVGVPLLLILIQPDLGTATVFTGIMVSMLIVAGVPMRYFAVLGLAGAIFLSSFTYIFMFHKQFFFEHIMHKYQWMRIESWLKPEEYPTEGYQLMQSLTAIGSGQLLGKGINQGTQAKNGWVPVGESDFVFTVIAEELGFIGSSILIFIYFFFIYRMIRIAMEAKDTFGMYVIAGVIGMYVFQVFENIGMTIQLMPITGLPLPFVSYGGSSLITNFFVMGIVLNIGMRRKKLMFE
ncbi:rod shape-determining protein RodA [Aneurinibacillus migulanus]|uniref:Rod shape-determining protein RodA n=1 Tax=Aneurinibacillus migulanus TaxID=47500 RepID=A0A0D1YKB3_ANEMI|nr:rod shape-determining protein RodA [Aneurinibacillus migulanus]KIV52828.1 rod shape-determining protein RodA [Aneurinibacillus migulanus]KIV59182.1 rod shape-determining protein RodA [Aneurinibacillus migulanus]KON95102.1 rod shape-determining protein RodA [Aneurinibacillus migulanus]KPD04787.1 rod shape-determining protein RodA [Aneurinibacillus migulanus]MED0895787.1 rod shape-determining protein RodA [Aneurinibacillus migulanus]